MSTLHKSHTAPKLPQKIFIANRGEIARRIGLTARRLGLGAVAVTDLERPPSWLVDAVTGFVHVPEESTSLYLSPARMIELAVTSGCDAVHPGFGFLSENAEFAAEVERRGLMWIGPRPESIAAMASKATARDWAVKAKVPVVEGLQGVDLAQDAGAQLKRLEDFAKTTGFPLLIKAAFGGGGKGMRLVHAMGDLAENARRASSEAVSSFGNGSLIVERYIAAPRHVEVQVLADKHGHVFAIGDRDCSLQRRHQKVIEEAPAPGLSKATRRAMHAAATSLAASVGYDSAGTVEFLVDGSQIPAHEDDLQRFWFLEMNTRLQVEHPVTEEVFGIDLVEWQIRVAAGESLPDHFGSLTPRGHSVEARIYAENVLAGFLPAPGPVFAFKPAMGPGVRWEPGLETVDEVTPRFDPMIAKLITTAETRPAALARMVATLQASFLATPHSNVELILWLAGASEFRERAVTTHFIADQKETFANWRQAMSDTLKDTAHALLNDLPALIKTKKTPSRVDTHSLTRSAFAESKSPRPLREPHSHLADAPVVLSEEHHDTRFWDHVTVGRIAKTRPDGKVVPFWYALAGKSGTKHAWIGTAGFHFHQTVTRPTLDVTVSSSAGGLDVTAPVPGKVVQVRTTPGTEVHAGAALVVLESMKMEFEVKAATSGHVEKVLVKVGDQVTAGAPLVTWKKQE